MEPSQMNAGDPRPPVRARAPKGRTLLIWTVLAITVLATATVQQLAQSAMTQPEIETDQLPPVPIQLLMSARYILGAGRIVEALGQTAGASNSPKSLLEQGLSGQAKSPLDRLRMVPVIAEVVGTEEALAALDELEALADFPEAARIDLQDLRTLYTADMELAEDRREALVTRHGWLGELALVYGLGDDDPRREKLLGEARNVALAMFAAGFFLLSLVGLGFVCMVVVIIRWATGKPLMMRFRQSEDSPIHHLALLETVAIFLAAFLLLPIVAQVMGLNMGIFTLVPLMLTPLWLLFRGLSPAAMSADMGWYRGEGFIKETVLGLVGYLTCLPILCVGLLITALLIHFADTQPVHPIVFELDEGIGELVTPFLMACVAAPLLEETLFRGIFFSYLRRFMPMVGAGLISGVIFAAVHPQGWAAIPALGSIGFVFAILREWRGSIIAPMAAHFANNFTILAIGVFIFG
ncbi:MAG: type II CAAX endopeptidase family protein [Acidobacteriota bacterium]|nr:type II CAAX endopeptidase family protein [Acidobacteriota bacterium]